MTQRRGMRYIDAPVTGIPENAVAGELTVLVGARIEDLASPQVVRNTRRMILGDHGRNITFTPRLRLKDVY